MTSTLNVAQVIRYAVGLEADPFLGRASTPGYLNVPAARSGYVDVLSKEALKSPLARACLVLMSTHDEDYQIRLLALGALIEGEKEYDDELTLLCVCLLDEDELIVDRALLQIRDSYNPWWPAIQKLLHLVRPELEF